MNIKSILFLLLSCCGIARAQRETVPSFSSTLTDSLHYNVEMQGSFADGKTPLWLNANKQGLSSLDNANGYLRASLAKPMLNDSRQHWELAYGVDLVVPAGYTSDFVIHQAYAQIRWHHGVLTVGSKENHLNLKNDLLSSGSQTLGINARPVPQVRLALPDYWTLPFGNGWLYLKGHIAYGKMTDEGWQHDFTSKASDYADGVLYHSKAGFFKIGNDERYMPFSVEMGLEMAAVYGGKAYLRQPDGTFVVSDGKGGLKGMWDAFFPGGADTGETTYKNVSGNQLGSWMLRFNWKEETWRFGFYVDKFFEDHSGMFMLDYDGYGEGEEWMTRKDRRYFMYNFKDWMLGAELNFTRNRWITDVVLEYLYTKYQSGPIYHDHTINIADHVAGRDNYYNHYIYPGWQHWGQVIGNPLYRSPIYNDDGVIEVKNNRTSAVHLGIAGRPYDNFNYRFLVSCQDGLGSYFRPYTKKHHNVSLMLETCYRFTGKTLRGCLLKVAGGLDTGKILGHNYGFQITFSKTGLLGRLPRE